MTTPRPPAGPRRVWAGLLALALALVAGPGAMPRASAARRMASSVASAPLRIQYIRRTAGSGGYNAAADKGVAAGAGGADQTPVTAARSWPGISGQAGDVEYHGGPLLTGPALNVYFIFYGDWSGTPLAALRTLKGFVDSLSTPPARGSGAPSVHGWWQISTRYTDARGRGVSRNVSVAQSVAVSQGYERQLGDGIGGGQNDVEQVVVRMLRLNKLPLDPNGFYAVLTSADVRVGDAGSTGFCGATQGYCAWHSQVTVDGTPVAYALVGDPTEQCPDACAQTAGLPATPNGHFNIDGMISAFAHELTEAATNPDTTTGYWAPAAGGGGGSEGAGAGGYENADLCAGQLTDDANPKLRLDAAGTYAYNLEGLNGLKFLVQTNVDLATQQCVLQAQASPIPGGNDTAPPPPDAAESPSSDDDYWSNSPSSDRGVGSPWVDGAGGPTGVWADSPGLDGSDAFAPGSDTVLPPSGDGGELVPAAGPTEEGSGGGCGDGKEGGEEDGGGGWEWGKKAWTWFHGGN